MVNVSAISVSSASEGTTSVSRLIGPPDNASPATAATIQASQFKSPSAA